MLVCIVAKGLWLRQITWYKMCVLVAWDAGTGSAWTIFVWAVAWLNKRYELGKL